MGDRTKFVDSGEEIPNTGSGMKVIEHLAGILQRGMQSQPDAIVIENCGGVFVIRHGRMEDEFDRNYGIGKEPGGVTQFVGMLKLGKLTISIDGLERMIEAMEKAGCKRGHNYVTEHFVALYPQDIQTIGMAVPKP